MLRPGARVSLVGLKYIPELNGAVGKVHDYDVETGFWKIDFGEFGHKNLCAENLEVEELFGESADVGTASFNATPASAPSKSVWDLLNSPVTKADAGSPSEPDVGEASNDGKPDGSDVGEDPKEDDGAEMVEAAAMVEEAGAEVAFPAASPAEVTELTDEQQDKQNALKQEATELLEDGKLEPGLEKLTEAIVVGCASALLYSRRAQVLMQLDRPRASISDCTAALAVNPDSAKAFKIRARCNRKLERWEEAHLDFQTALKVDYDEATYEESLDVAAKAKEIREVCTRKRVRDEQTEYTRKLQENKEAAEKEAKNKAEEERKARVRAREKASEAKDKGDTKAQEDGVPKSQAPAGAEDAENDKGTEGAELEEDEVAVDDSDDADLDDDDNDLDEDDDDLDDDMRLVETEAQVEDEPEDTEAENVYLDEYYPYL
jgi:hypothetical protein